MTRHLRITVFFLAVSTLTAQEPQVSFSPEHPLRGDLLAIRYDPSKGPLAGAKAIDAQVLVFRTDENPVVFESRMDQGKQYWSATFTLDPPGATALMVRFVSDKQTDDNNGDCWVLPLSGGDGKPVKGAYMALADMTEFGGFFEFKKQRDPVAARALLEQELQLYPGDWKTEGRYYRNLLRTMPGDSSIALASAAAERLFKQFHGDEAFLAEYITWLKRSRQNAKADSIRTALIAANPKGKVAENSRLEPIWAERDPARRISLIDAYLADFTPAKEILKNLVSLKVSAVARLGDMRKTKAALEQAGEVDAVVYNSAAWSFIEKGEELEDAVELARKGVELFRKANPAAKPSYYSTRTWKNQQESLLGMTLDTYAFGLFKLERYPDAEKAFAEAYKITRGEQDEINQRYIDCLMKTKNYRTAIRVSEECIKKGKANDQITMLYKEAYIRVKGSEKGFEKSLTSLTSAAKAELNAELMKQEMKKPAPSFVLKTIDGKDISLASLKGKVVLIDFWATWCGPCISSFPTLQKLYERYASDPRVAILAVNSWEEKKGEERKTHVKDFLTKNKYTFPVVIDEDNAVITKYGVEGIPTKFYVDPEGNIRFSMVGWVGEQKMASEVETLFEYLSSKGK